MPKKRKSSGRSKGGKGRSNTVQCDACGKSIPRDKAKKIYRRTSLVDSRLARELRKKGAYFPGSQSIKWYCINCAVHRGYYAPRDKEKRRKPYKKGKRYRLMVFH